MQTTTYQLRINTQDDSQILKVIDAPYIYVKEQGKNSDNPHTHAIFKTGLKRCAINKRIQTVDGYFPGNGFYSLKVLKPTEEDPELERPHAYLFKEGEPIHVGYSPEQISNFKQRQKEIEQKMKEDLKERKREKNTFKDGFLQFLTHDCEWDTNEKGFRFPLDPDTGGVFAHEKVARILVEYTYMINHNFFESQLVRTLQNVMLDINPSYHYHLQQRLLDRS